MKIVSSLMVASGIIVFSAIDAFAQSSAFDLDNEGWINNHRDPAQWIGGGGNPGGYITNALEGQWAVAPSQFYDRPYRGGRLSFDFMQLTTTTVNSSPLIGVSGVTYDSFAGSFNFGVYINISTPLDVWGHYSFSTIQSYEGPNPFGDPYYWNTVDLEVAGPGTWAIDNVTFTPGSRVPPPSSGPGSSQQNPILPSATNPTFVFHGGAAGWVDPPLASGFIYQTTDGSLFTYIGGFPTGFDHPFTVSVGGKVLGTFGPGNEVDFTSFPGGGVSSFKVTGISPSADPTITAGFPLYVEFNANTADFTMQAVPVLRGDFNRDGKVTDADIQVMLNALTDLHAYESAQSLTDNQLQVIGDMNNDGKVTNADLQSLLDLVAAGGGSLTAVPEPRTFVLTAIAGWLALGTRMNRRRLSALFTPLKQSVP